MKWKQTMIFKQTDVTYVSSRNLTAIQSKTAGKKISAIPTTPSQHGWCHPTNSHWAPPDPQVWAGTRTTTSGRSRPARCSSSWRPPWPPRGDTGSWSSGGSRWPMPCHDGREPVPPPLAAKTAPASPEQDSCWGKTSVCRRSCLSLSSSKSFVVQMFYTKEWCVIFLGQIQKWTSLDILR